MTEGQILGLMIDPNSPYLFSDAFIFGILRWMVLLGFGLYLLFSIVIVRQIHLMTTTVGTGFELPIKMLGYLHLAFAIIVWLIAFTTL